MRRHCPYCLQLFTPSTYHPDQVVCSQLDCQRRRRTDYHRQKIQTDPAYRAQCKDSQEKWRDLHPEYMRSYRKTRGRPSQRKPSKTHGDERQKLLVELVENNVALDLKACGAKIWLICADDLAKNTFASAQVIVIKMIAREKKQSGL